MLIPTFGLLSNPTIASDSRLHRVSAGVSEQKKMPVSIENLIKCPRMNRHESKLLSHLPSRVHIVRFLSLDCRHDRRSPLY
jgi:hypothetical protein